MAKQNRNIIFTTIAIEAETDKLNKNLWKRRIKRDKCLRNACQ